MEHQTGRKRWGKRNGRRSEHGIIILWWHFSVAIPFVVYGKNIDSKETIRIGYIDYGGFIDLDENGEYTGYGVELLDKIAEYTGWKYEYVYDTWDNILKNWSQVRLIWSVRRREHRNVRRDSCFRSIGREQKLCSLCKNGWWQVLLQWFWGF